MVTKDHILSIINSYTFYIILHCAEFINIFFGKRDVKYAQKSTIEKIETDIWVIQVGSGLCPKPLGLCDAS